MHGSGKKLDDFEIKFVMCQLRRQIALRKMQHKLTEQIAADKHLGSKDAVTKSKRELRFNKLVPAGAD